MVELYLKNEVYQIVGAAMEVYNELGHGFLEPIYQECLGIEFGLRGIPFVEQQEIKVHYKGRELKKGYKPDFDVWEAVVLEIKAEDALCSRDESQLINYLKATKRKVGVLINFGSDQGLEWKRFVL